MRRRFQLHELDCKNGMGLSRREGAGRALAVWRAGCGPKHRDRWLCRGQTGDQCGWSGGLCGGMVTQMHDHGDLIIESVDSKTRASRFDMVWAWQQLRAFEQG